MVFPLRHHECFTINLFSIRQFFNMYSMVNHVIWPYKRWYVKKINHGYALMELSILPILPVWFHFLSPGGCGNGHHRYSRDPKRQRLDPHGRQLLHHRVGSGGRSTYLWKCAEVCHCISEIMAIIWRLW